METLQLNAWERIYMIQLSNRIPAVRQNFTAYDYKKLMQLMDKMELSEEEEEEIGFSEPIPGRYRWDDGDKEWEIEISRNDRQIIDMIVGLLRKGPVPDGDVKRVVALSEKLGVYEEETGDVGEDSDVDRDGNDSADPDLGGQPI
jgi:hypothetical protein